MKKHYIIIVFLAVLIMGVAYFVIKTVLEGENATPDIEDNKDRTTDLDLSDDETGSEDNEMLTEGMVLNATGVVREVIYPPVFIDSHPEVIITLDDVYSAGDLRSVRILNKGCIDTSISTGEKVLVVGEVVNIYPGFAIILACDNGVMVKRIDEVLDLER